MRRGSRRGSWNPEEDVKERVTASEEHIKDRVKTEIEALAKVNDAQQGELAVKVDSVAKVAESGAEDVKMVRSKAIPVSALPSSFGNWRAEVQKTRAEILVPGQG